MKKMMPILLLGLLISSCSSYRSMINAESNIKKVEIGMTKEQVVAIMGKSYQRIGMSQLPEDEKMEILGYETLDYGIYNFYFINGILTEWRKEWMYRGNQFNSGNPTVEANKSATHFNNAADKNLTKIHLDAHRRMMLSGAKTEAERAAVNAHMDAHERAVLGN